MIMRKEINESKHHKIAETFVLNDSMQITCRTKPSKSIILYKGNNMLTFRF